MPRISINEIDNTIYSINELTNDNIVYVPGNMPKGEYRHPVLLKTVEQFEKEYGTYSPNGGHTYDYVKGLLLAGLPVLFRRIVALNQDSESPAEPTYKIEQAKLVLTTEEPETESSKAYIPAQSTSWLNKTVAEMVNDNGRILEDGTVKAVFKHIEGWTEFSSKEEEQSGYFFPFKLDDTITGTTMTFKKNGEVTKENIPFDPEIIFKIEKDVTFEVIVDDVSVITFNFTESLFEGIDEETVLPDTKTVEQLVITEKTGGSYGNNYKVSIEPVAQSLFFRVYMNGKMIEDERITTLTGDEDADRNNEIKFFQEHEFDTVNVAFARPEELDSFVLPIVTLLSLTGGVDIEDTDVIAEIPNSFNFIVDKYLYDVKFVTGGGYTNESIDNMAIAEAQVRLCETRKDCFAILDIPRGTPKSSVPRFFTNLDTSFGATFAPWCYTKLPGGEEKWMMPSYLFLYTLGRSIQDGNPVYSAPAGVLKASMPQVIKPEYEIGGDTLDLWQDGNPQAINPLMKLRNYGYVIYGQKTLYNIQNKNSAKASALQEINVRLAVNEIRRVLFNAAIRLTFQANNQRTWNEFKALVEPKLQSMVSNGGITDFLVKMDSTTTTEEDIQNNTIRAKVYVSVSKAVENFEIDFYIEPQAIKFADETNAENVLVGGIYAGIDNSELAWASGNNS